MKKKLFRLALVLSLSFSFLPNAFCGLLFKMGVFDVNKIIKKFPEARKQKQKWDKLLNRRYYLLTLYHLKKDFLKDYKEEKSSLSDRNFTFTTKAFFHKEIKRWEKKKSSTVRRLMRNDGGLKLKRQLFRALKEARRNKGFGIIFSSHSKILIFNKRWPSFNYFVLEVLMPDDKKKHH